MVKKKAVNPNWTHRLIIFVFTLFVFSPPVETQVPDCTEFLRNFCRDVQPCNYLKIETLLAIAATATIATAIIVIVSIKQSPFFKSINNYCLMFN